ncbi:MAG: glycosyltransferase family 4 protein [Cyclobacteriaceae bacterium]|nr:glycosyltransferase family 4 protein [Cyclobacteriaceae bacterium]
MNVVVIDLYSTSAFYYGLVCSLACKMFGIHYIPILRGGDLPARWKRNPSFCRIIFSSAKWVVSPSKYLYSFFGEQGISNLQYIPNPVRLAICPFSVRALPRPRLLWVRSFHEIYNPLLAVEVFHELKKVYPNATLAMIGPAKDDTLEQCISFCKSKSLTNVHFPGLMAKEAWIQRSAEYDIFINTARFDNIPVSVMEAMALGLPVVSTNVGGIPFLIDHGFNGLLVPSEDRKAMVDAVIQLCSDGTLALRLARNARATVEEFDEDRVYSQWQPILA